MENKNHWSDNRKRTDQSENTNRRQKVKYCSVRELNMFGQRLTCDCDHTVCILHRMLEIHWPAEKPSTAYKGHCSMKFDSWTFDWLVNQVHSHGSYARSLTSQCSANIRNCIHWLVYSLTFSCRTTYRVIQEESALLWEMIVWVILSKKVHTNMGPILNGYGVMTAWNLEKKVTIIDNERKKIINQHNTLYI